MDIKEFTRLSLNKVLITFGLAIFLFVIGITVFNDPIFFNKGCAYNPNCQNCEICLPLPLTQKIRYETLLLIFPLYLIACSFDNYIMKKKL